MTRYLIDPLANVYELGMTSQPGAVIVYDIGTGLVTLPLRVADIVTPLQFLWQAYDRAFHWTNELVGLVTTPSVPCSYRLDFKTRPSGKWRSETTIAGLVTATVYSLAGLTATLIARPSIQIPLIAWRQLMVQHTYEVGLVNSVVGLDLHE